MNGKLRRKVKSIETSLETVTAVLRPIERGTDPASPDGRKVRMMLQHLRQLQSELQALAEEDVAQRLHALKQKGEEN